LRGHFSNFKTCPDLVGVIKFQNIMSSVAITAADINKLRQMTGAGMMDCRKA
jgi:hypothetical protein